MTLAEFHKSLADPAPPDGLNVPLRALWHEAKGNWKKAHELVQDDHTSSAAWVHAHLHRKEGDSSNARYWYDRAGEDSSHLDLAKEWDAIASSLIDRL